ncbi:jg826, partial [Pararge aegeria aegeria]
NVSARAKAATYALYPLFKSRLPMRTKLEVYKTYIRPILTYAAPAWYALVSESNRKTMRAQQSAALRKVASAPRYVRNSVIQRDLRIEPIECFITQLARRMFARTETTYFHPS